MFMICSRSEMRSLTIVLGGFKHRMKAHWPGPELFKYFPKCLRARTYSGKKLEPDSLGFKGLLCHLLIQNLKKKKKRQ